LPTANDTIVFILLLHKGGRGGRQQQQQQHHCGCVELDRGWGVLFF
jgi:hypothetical protein